MLIANLINQYLKFTTMEINLTEEAKEYGLLCAVLSAHFLNKSALIRHYDQVKDVAEKFFDKYNNVKDWYAFIEKGNHKNAEGDKIKPTDWEDFLVMWARPLLRDVRY